MRSYFHHTSGSRTAPRRSVSRSLSPSSRSVSTTRTRAEHAEIARASSAWEHEVAKGLAAFVGQTIPLGAHEGLTVSHVLNLAEDETFAGWYNWRGITNPDMVLLGVLVGGPDNGATAAMAVDAKLSARSSKTQVLTETLAQLLEPFQPLANLVDSLLGENASDRLVLRGGFHVVRGITTTIGTAAKSTRALQDPEYAAEFAASRPVSLRPRQSVAPREHARPTAPERAPRRQPAAWSAPTGPTTSHTALFAETVWSLDRLCVAGIEMPEPKGVYHMDDIVALDDRPGAPAEVIILGTHGTERIAQAVVLGAKRALPDGETVRSFLATLPAPISGPRYRIVPAFRVVGSKTDTLPVLGNRRAVVVPA